MPYGEVQSQEIKQGRRYTTVVMFTNRFAAVEHLGSGVHIKSAWETIRKNISAKESLGYFELKKHTPWLNEGY
jgi:hypothetical protein